MQGRIVMLCILLLIAPVAGAQSIEDEIEHIVSDAETILEETGRVPDFLVSYAVAHADCDVDDLGFLQSDGYNATGVGKACDAPDALADLDADRHVAVNESTRGFLFFAHEGVDDDDFLTLKTQVDDREFRYALSFDLGLGLAREVEFGAIDFDVLTLDGWSLLDYQSPAYDVPEGFGLPDFPLAGPGREYHEVDVAGGYTTSTTEYKMVATPEAGSAATQAWLLLEDDSWVELSLQSDTSTAKKYTAPAAAGACGVVKIVVELPEGGAKQAPHIAHAPPRGSCEGSIHDVPPPSKAPMEGSFTVPAWLAGQDLAVRIWVTEYTPDALARQASEAGPTAQSEVLGLFAPRPASCDDQGACLPSVGGGKRADEPIEWDLDLNRFAPSAA